MSELNAGRRRVVIAGIGGQGVVYATKVLAQAARLKGQPVLASENHGMSQRGGSVNAHLQLGGGAAPLIRRGTADALIALDAAEALRNLLFVRPGGAVYVNAAEGLAAAVAARLAEQGTQLHVLDAAALAQALGTPGVANVVLLGLVAAHGRLGLTPADLQAAIEALGPRAAVPLNWQALAIGAAHYAAV